MLINKFGDEDKQLIRHLIITLNKIAHVLFELII